LIDLTKCPNCGKEFDCGVERKISNGLYSSQVDLVQMRNQCGSSDCWCFSKEKKQPTGDKCVCEECLDKME